MRHIFRFLICLGALTATGALADDVATCRKESGDVAIEACNRVINSGRYSNQDVADSYMNRSAEWVFKSEYDRAIQDANAALKLNPNFSQAYTNRGAAWAGKKEYDRAIADHSKAIEIDTSNPASYVNRGEIKELRGDVKGAVSDYKAALAAKPKPGRYDNAAYFYDKARDRLKELAKQ